MALNRITVDSLAANAVTNVAVANGTIVSVDLADGAVTGPKIGLTAINANNVVGGLLSASSATTFTANQTFVVANVTNQLISSGAAYQNIIRLTDAATITPNLAQTNNFIVTLGGSRTMANATNILPGQSGVIFVQQDGTGSRTLAFGTGWRFPSNTAPTLTTTAYAVDMIVYTAWSSSNLAAQAVLNVT
jgi:hypothetical protein